jgi:hypothetical protein
MAFFAACSSLTLQPVNYAWPLESVLAIDGDGNVAEDRYYIGFNTKGLFFEEFEDSSAYMGKEIRMIRDAQGFYYITSPNFKNVYVFTSDEGSLCLDNKILISETGIESPAFNQRIPFIELVNGGNKTNLTNEGVEGSN